MVRFLVLPRPWTPRAAGWCAATARRPCLNKRIGIIAGKASGGLVAGARRSARARPARPNMGRSPRAEGLHHAEASIR